MATWTSLALLSALAVSALSLPDESAYQIPQVGTGRRSQYYVLHKDGTFKYGLDTGDGAYETSRLHHTGRQNGKFGYRDPDGNTISLRYEAGEGGFRPTGDHIPSAHPDFYTAHAEARARPPFVDPLANPNADASYDFNFVEAGNARQEQSDDDGNVRGSYSYTDEDGRTRTYSYTAGRGTGFVVQGDDLPQAPLTPAATPAATSLSTGGAASSAFRTSSSRPSSFHTSSLHTLSSQASSAGFTSSSSRLPSRPFTASTRAGVAGFTSRSDTRPDGSYSFTYDAGDHSRSESANADLDVKGQFSFVADDGKRRQVTYEAGSNTGFLAAGDHLPQQPPSPHSSHGSQTTFSSGTPTASHTPTLYRTPTVPGSTAPESSGTAPHSGFSSNDFASTRQSSSPVEVSNTRNQLNPDGSYAFAYEAATHSRAETGDSNVNVDGSYDFVADDGQRRAIQYEAGSDTGFIAEGSHIPVGPPVPGAPSGQPTGRIVPVKESPFTDPLADTYSSRTAPRPGFLAAGDHLPQQPQSPHSSHGSQTTFSSGTPTASHTPTSYRTPTVPGSTAPESSGTAPHSSISSNGFASTRQSGSPVEVSNTRSQLNPDGSYAFAYEAATHSRAETGDSNVNVDGSYDFVADDGQRRAIQYEAGSDTGFIAEGSHIPVGPSVPGAPSGQPTGRIVPVQEVPFSDPLADSNTYARPYTASSSITPFSSSHTRASLSQANGVASKRGSHIDNFQLRQYDASENCGKHGYVLTFDS